jgi:Ser/Thr protein kinase RdoA (MazF antagonist)
MSDIDPLMREASSLLRTHGVGSGKLIPADGFANTVLMTPSHVIRLNTGRFPHAFAHEACVLSRLPESIPHPHVVAQGNRQTDGEFLILERLPGQNLELVWPELSASDHREIGRQLGSLLRTLHELTPAAWMENRWVEDVVASGRWGDGYHLPPSTIPQAIASASEGRPDLEVLLGQLAALVDDRSWAFRTNFHGFIHTDVHLRNILISDTCITGLIDFEGSRIGPIDGELDQLVRFMLNSEGPMETDYAPFIAGMRDTYPALLGHPDLIPRLEIYEAQWHLVQLHHWRPGATWTNDPAQGLAAIIAGQFAKRVQRLLTERG